MKYLFLALFSLVLFSSAFAGTLSPRRSGSSAKIAVDGGGTPRRPTSAQRERERDEENVHNAAKNVVRTREQYQHSLNVEQGRQDILDHQGTHQNRLEQNLSKYQNIDRKYRDQRTGIEKDIQILNKTRQDLLTEKEGLSKTRFYQKIGPKRQVRQNLKENEQALSTRLQDHKTVQENIDKNQKDLDYYEKAAKNNTRHVENAGLQVEIASSNRNHDKQENREAKYQLKKMQYLKQKHAAERKKQNANTPSEPTNIPGQPIQ